MNQPEIGIIMGSDSDLPIMQGAADILTQLALTYELTIVSAHRTPARLWHYAQEADAQGLQVIIAGAGGGSSFTRHGCCDHFFAGDWGTD
jgi:phosphoribosylaminoimidazole carboxylase PurE protein